MTPEEKLVAFAESAAMGSSLTDEEVDSLRALIREYVEAEREACKLECAKVAIAAAGSERGAVAALLADRIEQRGTS